MGTAIRFLCAGVCALGCFTVAAQNFEESTSSVEMMMRSAVSDVPVYDTANCPFCIFVAIRYGTSEFLNVDVVNQFGTAAIERVDMVYTSFSRSKNFDQQKLNRQRLEALRAISPNLFVPEVKWQFFQQTQCNTLEESEQLFHGFVVHLNPSKVIVDKGALKPKPEDKKPAKPKVKLVYHDTTIVKIKVTTYRNVKRDCEPTGRYYPRNKKKKKAGVRYETETAMLFWKRKPEKTCTSEVTYVKDTFVDERVIQIDQFGRPRKQTDAFGIPLNEVVKETMERKWNEWKDLETIIVQDVTASMSEYTGQILQWNEEFAASGVSHFLFFNDGDGKPDNKKVIGKIGGIYYINSSDFDEVKNVADRAERAGYGGDSPENNLEALLEAQKRCKTCDYIVMIADNSARVKDISLLKGLHKPVRIIVCGVRSTGIILKDYMTIAAYTGGSLHTDELDIDLSEAKNGASFFINDVEYHLENDRVMPVVE